MNHLFKLMLLVSTAMPLAVSDALAADPISKNVILSKVMDGSARFESKLIHFVLESADKSTLDSWASRQKIIYPKFETDLLYYRYTYDSTHEYQFYFNYIDKECLYEVRKREDVRLGRLCKDDIDSCIQKKGGASEENSILTCFKQSTNCSQISNKSSSPETIDKKYCEKIYGRSL